MSRLPVDRSADGSGDGDSSAPHGAAAAGGGSAGGGTTVEAAAARAAWAQRLRLVQEALILLRSLLADPALGAAAADWKGPKRRRKSVVEAREPSQISPQRRPLKGCCTLCKRGCAHPALQLCST